MKNVSLSRRSFLKYSIITSCTVFVPKTSFAKQSLLILNNEDTAFLKAIIPIFLDGVKLTPTDIEEIISNVDTTIHHMPLSTQDELTQLFWLMRQRIFRVLLAGIWSDWQNAQPENIHRLLNIWKDDQLGVLDVAYLALHDLILGSWYANEKSWQAINYPGAIKL